jgi:hypothetical protein
MAAPDITPEHGVAGYEYDHTQGPACAMAAGAATIFRNYFVFGDGTGQTAARQLNGLEDILRALDADWCTMRNGYAFCTQAGLTAAAARLGQVCHG